MIEVEARLRGKATRYNLHIKLQESLLNDLLYSWTSFCNTGLWSFDVCKYNNRPQMVLRGNNLVFRINNLYGFIATDYKYHRYRDNNAVSLCQYTGHGF